MKRILANFYKSCLQNRYDSLSTKRVIFGDSELARDVRVVSLQVSRVFNNVF